MRYSGWAALVVCSAYPPITPVHSRWLQQWGRQVLMIQDHIWHWGRDGPATRNGSRRTGAATQYSQLRSSLRQVTWRVQRRTLVSFNSGLISLLLQISLILNLVIQQPRTTVGADMLRVNGFTKLSVTHLISNYSFCLTSGNSKNRTFSIFVNYHQNDLKVIVIIIPCIKLKY